MNKELSIYQTKIFKLKIPASWIVESKDFVYSFYDPCGKGVLQVSTYSANKEEIRIDFRKEIEKIIKNNPIENFLEASKGELRYVLGEFIEKGFLTKIKLLQKGKHLALITYNVKTDSALPEEIALVELIFNSFDFKNGDKKGDKKNGKKISFD